jgi:hypothetical protein
MANTNTFQQAPTNTTDATFRLWGKALSDAFAAVGLVKDTDASQIDWATVLKPGAGATFMGYEIWRFDDALQATCPVYFKIQYGSGGVATYPAIILQVGQGSDNAGNLLGTKSTANTVASGAANATSYSCFISSDKSRVSIAMFTGSAGNIPWGFYIERLKNDSGINIATGVNIVTCSTVSTAQYLPLSGAAYPATPMATPQSALPSTGQASYGNNIGVFPIYPNIGYAGNPDLGAMIYFTGDISAPGSMLTVNIYGADHIYVTLGANTGSTSSYNGNSTSHSLAFRYE